MSTSYHVTPVNERACENGQVGDNEVVPRRARPSGGAFPLVSLDWNGWSVSSGISGQFAPEYAEDHPSGVTIAPRADGVARNAGRSAASVVDLSGKPGL